MPKVYMTREDRQLEMIFRQICGARKTKHISQAKIAEELCMKQTGYSAIEKRKDMSLRQFLTVCEAIGEKPSEILKIAEGN